MGAMRAPEGVQRVAEGRGNERGAEAACEGAHVLRQQIERRQLNRHVWRDACDAGQQTLKVRTYADDTVSAAIPSGRQDFCYVIRNA